MLGILNFHRGFPMSENAKAAVTYTTIIVLALLAFWIGVRLIEAMVPVMGRVIDGNFFGRFVAWAITIAGTVLIALLTILMPLIVGTGLLLVLLWISDLIIGRVKKVSDDIRGLGKAISAQAREAAIDTSFLGILAMLAALVFYMGTKDYLDPFSKEALHSSDDNSATIHVLVVAAAACSISKMLFLIPVRSVKVISVFAMAATLVVTAGILIDGYITKSVVLSDIRQSSVATQSVMATSFFLLLVAVAYPFTLSGWRRMWYIESERHPPATLILSPQA
jgi:hypothetical protein